jgi:hypothetical protein
MKIDRFLVCVAAAVLCTWPSVSLAAGRCVPAHWRAAEAPGWDFDEVPLSKTPKSSGCGDNRALICEVRDSALGYVYSLGSMNGAARPLLSKRAYREDGAKRLPFGVSWNDGPEAVMRKVREAGEYPDRSGSEIFIFTCWWPSGDGASTTFEFGRDGKLAVVRQFVQP